MSDSWVPDPRFDLRPSPNPYPARLPDLATPPAPGKERPLYVHQLAMAERTAHELAVLVDSGDRSRLRELQRAILEYKALREEMGTGVETLTAQSQAYLDMEPETGDLA